jgi:RNA polymerase sigma factor (sigma-70 family)
MYTSAAEGAEMASGQLTSILRHIRHLVGRGDAGATSDRQLLRRYADSRDGQAFATLVQRHGSLVLGVCQRVLGNSHDAEDAFQAVFVVLARKAGATGWKESIGPWLHEVAYRVALRARARAQCRAEHERRAADMRPAETAASAWTDLRGVLDAELRCLPDRYREPLVLCYLQGKSNEEAAEQLGWPAGTVKSRLSRGRDLLRDRLTRRGLTLTAEALVLLMAQNASAAVPQVLSEIAIKAATLVAAGQAVGGLNGPAAALAEGALRAMSIAKLRTMAVVALLLVATGVAGWLTYRTWAADPADKKDEAKKEIMLPKDPKAVVVSMTVTGGMIRNKTNDPYLQILADGQVIVIDRVTGAKKESKLTPEKLQELLRFIVQDQDFLALTEAKIKDEYAKETAKSKVGIAVGDGCTSRISVKANDKESEVGYYAASAFSKQFPKVKSLAQFAAVENRLNDLAVSVQKGK